MRDNWLSAELIAKSPECSGMLLFSPFCSEIWQCGRRGRGKAKFNGLLTRNPLFARAGGVRCVLSVYLAGQFGGGISAVRAGNVGQFGSGKSGGAAGGRGCYTMQGTPVYGEGGSGKTAGPFWAWGRIHHPHPFPHSTVFNRLLPDIIPSSQNFPPSIIAIHIRRAEGRGGGAGKKGSGVF